VRERVKADRGVVAAGCEIKESNISFGGVAVRIAAVRRWVNTTRDG